jgi:PAS domain S-box-containing protein
LAEKTTPQSGRAKKAAALGQARLDDVLESISDGFYAVDRDWRYFVFNRAAEEFFGVSRELLLGRVMWDVFPQGRGTPFEAACISAMEQGGVHRFETGSRLRPDRVVELRIGPLEGGGVAVALTDVTERARVEKRLKQTTQRLDAILDNTQMAIFLMDERQHCVFMNAAAEALTGYTLAETQDRTLHDLIHHTRPDGAPFPIEECAIDRAFPENNNQTGEEVFVHKDGHFYPVAFTASPVRDEASRTVGTVIEARDITAEKQAEEHLKLLVLELNHRVKNNLATVQAIAVQTLRGSETPAEAREAFLRRITALATAHDILTREQWEGVGVTEVARGVLDALHGAAERVQMEGPEVRLPPKAALSLSMAFHELGTNALKYGALSTPDGGVLLTWALGSEGQELLLRWTEHGGPPVAPPTTRGFGSRLLERGLAAELRGEVKMIFDPEGLSCTIRAPLDDPSGPYAPTISSHSSSVMT